MNEDSISWYNGLPNDLDISTPLSAKSQTRLKSKSLVTYFFPLISKFFIILYHSFPLTYGKGAVFLPPFLKSKLNHIVIKF